MKTLKISNKISLPLDAVTQTIAAIGRKGAGKTYLASMICEQMIDAQAQVIVLDPIGNWYGLRISADGKKKGKDIFVIGGSHGDVPLVPEVGARIAQLIVEKGISAILDISSFRLGERKRFAADFGEELLHLKKTNKTPLHIFIEEAQLIIPQRVGPEEARMVGAYEQIVRLGRNYGIGATLITQRPQSVNKEVLSQVECLCVLQVTGPHERKALEAWVQEAGADRSLVGELPGLKRGEGYVWSPAWLRIFERVEFSKKQTFDASATPEVGKIVKAAKLSTVDVELLKSDMSDIVVKASENDPKALKAQIKTLEKALVAKNGTLVTKQVQDPKAIEKAVNQALAAQARQYEAYHNRFVNEFKKVIAVIGKAKAMIPDTFPYPEQPGNKTFVLPEPITITSENVGEVMGKAKEVLTTSPETSSSLGKCSRMIYSFLVSRQGESFNKTQIAVAVGYSQSSGSFNNSLSELNSAGLITRGNALISLSGPVQGHLLMDIDSSLEKWSGKLGKCSREIWELLLRSDHTGTFNKQLIADETNYSVTSGSFNNSLSELSSLGLIERLPSSQLRINPDLLEI